MFCFSTYGKSKLIISSYSRDDDTENISVQIHKAVYFFKSVTTNAKLVSLYVIYSTYAKCAYRGDFRHNYRMLDSYNNAQILIIRL